MDISKSRKQIFLCMCGLKSERFNSMFISETGEIGVYWKCERCNKPCSVVIALRQYLLPEARFTEEDHQFLKTCNTHI